MKKKATDKEVLRRLIDKFKREVEFALKQGEVLDEQHFEISKPYHARWIELKVALKDI